MEALLNMKVRRSIRTYEARQISEEALGQILEAGTYAPSGNNHQSARIIAVQDKDVIEKLRRLNAAVMGKPDADPFYGAPTVIVVLVDKHFSTYREDGALVMGNLLNACAALSLGSCWVHRAKEEFETDEGKALLKAWGVEGDYVGIGHCIVGYPACDWPEPAPRKADYILRV